jgi:hypothetical protein
VSNIRATGMAVLCAAMWIGLACDVSTQSDLLNGANSAPSPAPDGIDPQNPNVERTSSQVDFSGVRMIRVELPTGRVSVSQAEGDADASLRVTEIITAKGLSNDALNEFLTNSRVTAERSFVDESRLDLEATVAPGLTDTDIAFDIRLVVPSGVNLEIVLANGPVEVIDVVGNVEIHTANAPISVNRVQGGVIAETSERPIDILDVTGNVRAKTTAANITLRLAPPANGRVVAETTAGEISMSIAQATAAALSLSAPDGAVTANLSGFTVTNVATANGSLTGILNGGGGRIEARAPDGQITFTGM